MTHIQEEEEDYLVKVEKPKMLLTLTAPQQTVDMSLRTL